MSTISDKRLDSLVSAIVEDISQKPKEYKEFLNGTDPYVMSLTKVLYTFDGLAFGLEIGVKKPVVEPTKGMLLTVNYPHVISITCYQVTDTKRGGTLWLNPFSLGDDRDSIILSSLMAYAEIKSYCDIILVEELPTGKIYDVALIVSLFKVNMLFRRNYLVEPARPNDSANRLVDIITSIRETIRYIASNSEGMPPVLAKALTDYSESKMYSKIISSCEPAPSRNLARETVRKKMSKEIHLDWPFVIMCRPDVEQMQEVESPRRNTRLRVIDV